MQDVSVTQFLEALFFSYEEGVETPVLGQTRTRASDNSTVFWAYRWPGIADLDAVHHASLALQVPTEPHQTSRKANFTGGIGIVLDDVLEKVPAPDLKPTWIIETKPGSQQWGYLFDEPLRDQTHHDQLIRAVIDAGLSDPGMKSVTRWFRLPGSKPIGKKHTAKLVQWNPMRRFKPEELREGLCIDSLPKRRATSAALAVYEPHDEVFDWLRASDPAIQPGSDGWWQIACPWAELHTDGDRRAYYLPRGGPNPRRGFNCFHSHKHSTQDFLDWVGAQGGPKVDPEDLPSWQMHANWRESAVTSALTDLQINQDELALKMGVHSWDHDARYVANWKRWLFWDGTRWAVDERLQHMSRTRVFLRHVAEEMMQQAQIAGKGLSAQEVKKLLTKAKREGDKLRDKTMICAVELLARSNPNSVAEPEAFDTDTMLLGTPGGTVDLRTGVLRPAERDDLITKLAKVTPTDPGTTPRRWLQFLDEIFEGDRDIIGFMQRAAGYALTGEVSEHKLFFLFGGGRNGKSVFLNTLFDLYGDYARKAASATFLNSQQERHPTDVAGLKGARLVAGSELPAGKTWDESVIKDLTGGDVMTARFMRADFFDFKPQLTLMIAGNNQPSFRGVDEAIRSRVVLVPFKVTIPKEQQDPDLPAKLLDEGPAILRWAIDGAVKWREEGLNVPMAISEATSEYFDTEDIVGRFLADETEGDPSAFLASRMIHSRFSSWCEAEGLRPFAQTTLVKELSNRGYAKAKSGDARGLKGLSLRQQSKREQQVEGLQAMSGRNRPGAAFGTVGT